MKNPKGVHCLHESGCERVDLQAHGLCMTHYQDARRHGELYLYPTTTTAIDPENAIREIFQQFPEAIADVAIEYGYSLTKV